MPQNGRSAGQGRATPSPGPTYRLPQELRGYKRLRLLKDLATSPASPRELAQAYQVRLPALLAFRQAHQEEIAELSRALSQGLPIDTQGMWITKKENRLAELEHEAEAIRNSLQNYRDEGIDWSRSHRDMIRTYLEILRTVADETGAYPQRQAPAARSGSTVHYVIDTGSPDATEALT